MYGESRLATKHEITKSAREENADAKSRTLREACLPGPCNGPCDRTPHTRSPDPVPFKVVVSEFSLFGFGLPSGMGPSPAVCSAPIACFDSLQESMCVCALLKLSNYFPLTCFISTYSTDK